MRASPDQLLQLCVEQVQDHAIVLLDPAGMIVAWLAGAEKIFGYAVPEAIGRSVAMLFTPEDNERGVSDHELNVARSDGRAEDDRWLIRKDGGRFWASGVAVALRLNGEIMGFGKVLRDRTEVRAQIETLENRAKALDATIARNKNFISLLAHEIRNPLNTIRTAMHGIATLSTEATKPFIDPIQRQINFMVRLVEDLQEVSRAHASKLTLRRERVVLQDLLNQAAEAARPHAEKRGQSFQVLLIPTALTVEADPERIVQMLVNLLENAIKYTPSGGSIWLKCTIEGDQAVIGVEDSGIGIEKEVLPNIFELFTQAKSSRSVSQGSLGAGLGLGLPLVKELVTLHGGSIQVSSAGKNQGTQFTVRLQLADDQGPASA